MWNVVNYLVQFNRTEFRVNLNSTECIYSIPPQEQDVTRGQFFSAVQQDWIQSFPSPRPVFIPRLKRLLCQIFTHSLKENSWIHAFPGGICVMWNANSLIQEIPVVIVVGNAKATRVQILNDTDCISLSTNTLGKGMNPIILPPATVKIVGQTGFFSFGAETSLGEGKLY